MHSSVAFLLLLPIVLAGDILTELKEDFDILADLSDEAGLKDLLSSPGPITVFAPTNQAFSNLQHFVQQKLFEDREHLKKVIQYHVVSGSHPYDAITDETSLATMEGSELRLNKFQKTDGHPEFPSFVTVNGKLVVGSIAADNGVIHIISDLLYPLPVVSIAEILSLDPRFSSLEKAVKTAGMEETLATGGPFTLFAPTKKAFEGMEDNEDPVKSKELIQRHLVSGSYFAARLVNHTISSESGESLKVTLEKGENSFLTVLCEDTKAVVTEPDVLVTNGVVHAINTIL